MSEPLQSGNFPEGGIPELTLPKVGFPTPNPFDIQVKLMDPPPEEDDVDSSGMWAVSLGAPLTPAMPGDPSRNYEVNGGVLTVQEYTVEVADATLTDGVATGFVYLKVGRDSASREYDSHVIEWSDTALTSDYAYEYYLLASVVDEEIRQHRFEEIISWEEMVVANGSLKLLPFVALTYNSYDPPP